MDDFAYLAMGGKLTARIENVAGVMLVRCRSHGVDPTIRFDLLPEEAHKLADLLDEAGSQATGIATALTLSESPND